MIRVLTGKNSYALNERKRELIAKFLEKNTDFGLERIDASEAEPSRVADALTTLPFLGGERMVVVRDASLNKELIPMLPGLLPRVPETTSVIFIEPQLDSRSEAAKLYTRLASVEKFSALSGNELRRWLEKSIQEAGLTATPRAVDRLLEEVDSQVGLSNEIEKLSLRTQHIDEATVDELVGRTLKATVFEMLDQLVSSRPEKAIETYRALRNTQVDTSYVMSMLGWQLHLMLTVWAAGDRGAEEVAKDSGFSPYSVRKTSQLVRRLRKQQIKGAIGIALDADYRTKSQKVDSDGLVETSLLRLGRLLA